MNINNSDVNISIIGLCSFATHGKDTLFSSLNHLRPGLFKRYAFADQLKKDLEPLCYKMFGDKEISQLTASEKSIIRPLLIAYGCQWRMIDIDHWVKIVDKEIEFDKIKHLVKGYKSNPNPFALCSSKFHERLLVPIPVICDVRFPSEYEFFAKKYGDRFALVEVVRTDATSTPPDEELKNHPEVAKYAKYKVEWPTLLPNQMDKINEYGEKLLKEMGL